MVAIVLSRHSHLFFQLLTKVQWPCDSKLISSRKIQFWTDSISTRSSLSTPLVACREDSRLCLSGEPAPPNPHQPCTTAVGLELPISDLSFPVRAGLSDRTDRFAGVMAQTDADSNHHQAGRSLFL